MTDRKDEDLIKDSNPKDSVGVKKVPFSTLPAGPIAEAGDAMLEGALKYGRHNYRAVGVRASVYYDAALRHLTAWWEGEDIDPASGINHIGKAIATLLVLRDAQMNDKCADDRPPSMQPGWQDALNAKAGALIEKYPDPPAAYVRAPEMGENVLKLVTAGPIENHQNLVTDDMDAVFTPGDVVRHRTEPESVGVLVKFEPGMADIPGAMVKWDGIEAPQWVALSNIMQRTVRDISGVGLL